MASRAAILRGLSVYKRFLKRLFDLILGSTLFLLSLPLLLTCILLLYFSGRRVFFFQERPGYRGKVFKIYKLCTMDEIYDSTGKLLPDEERLTPLGAIIRKLSLDEVPQLINVIKGEMSLVGPRPLLTDYLELYGDYEARRHEVPPGITGLAQIKGRNATTWRRRFKYDVFYVDHLSFFFDLKILYLTFFKVLSTTGVASRGRVGIEPFKGFNS